MTRKKNSDIILNPSAPEIHWEGKQKSDTQNVEVRPTFLLTNNPERAASSADDPEAREMTLNGHVWEAR